MKIIQNILIVMTMGLSTLVMVGCSGGEADYSLEEVAEGIGKISFLSRANVIVEKTADPLVTLKVSSTNPVTLTLLSGDDLFSIDQNNSYIVYADNITAADITETYYTIVVQAEDSNGKTVNQVITIEFVDDINTVTPQIEPTYSTTPYIVVGDTDPFIQMDVYDPRGDGIVYSLSGANSNMFDISNDGALSIKPNVTTGVYEVIVVVTDSQNSMLKAQTSTITVTVVASEADLKPTIISDHFNYAENSSDPIQVVTQSNIPDTLRYSLGGTDDYYLNIDPITGVISFDVYYGLPNYEFPEDSNGDNTYEVEVTVTDGNGHSDNQAVTISILDVDDAPTSIVFESSGTTSISVKDSSSIFGGSEYYDRQILAVSSPTQGDLTYSIESIVNADSKVTFSLSLDGNLNIRVKNTSASQIEVNVKVEELRGEVSYQKLLVNVTE